MPSPIIFVCGPTGSGKTAVSIKLAQELQGEVVNADAFQMYKGLDIATAKITESEMQGVIHHVLSVFDPKESADVTRFIRLAVPAIRSIEERGRVPIIVGGSNFYLESLMFVNPALEVALEKTKIVSPSIFSSSTTSYKSYTNSCNATSKNNDVNDNDESDDCKSRRSASSGSGSLLPSGLTDLHALLQQKDPSAASLIHPRDTRRVQRALEMCSQLQSRDTPTTELLALDCVISKDSQAPDLLQLSSPRPPRFPSSLVVQVLCPDQPGGEHASLLHSRVDNMIAQGLVAEARCLFQYLHSSARCWEDFTAVCKEEGAPNFPQNFCGSSAPLQTISGSSNTCINLTDRKEVVAGGKGRVAEAIGFKEFIPYFTSSEESASVFAGAVSSIKRNTVQYAKKQSTWIRNRLVPQCLDKGVPVFQFRSQSSATDSASAAASGCVGLYTSCSQLASAIAIAIAGCSSGAEEDGRGTYTSNEKESECCSLENSQNVVLKRKIFQCSTCKGQFFQGKDQFDIHNSSRKHKKRLASLKRPRREAAC